MNDETQSDYVQNYIPVSHPLKGSKIIRKLYVKTIIFLRNKQTKKPLAIDR